MFTNKWPKDEIAKFINYVIHPEKGQETRSRGRIRSSVLTRMTRVIC